MVLGKVLDKFRIRSTKESANSSADLSRKQLDGGDETKKKMKKVRSLRISPKIKGQIPLNKRPQPATKSTDESPNYMKPTTSYEKRKEKGQVTTIDPPTSTIKTKNSNFSTVAKALVKNSSLRLVRASVKKHTAKIPQLKQGSMATCSPTIDSKAPDSVDLNKNGDCPYSYCSLHGHNHSHGPVPALKRFLSKKVQNSMKLRGYSSIEKKGGKEIELVDDVVNELFIEIHTKLQEQTLQQEWGEERSKEGILVQESSSSSITSFEDCGDKNSSELSMEEIQVINQFLEYIENECQEKTQAQSEVKGQFQNAGIRSQSTSFGHGFEKENIKLQSFVEHPQCPHVCVELQEEIGANLNTFAKDETVHAHAHAQLKVDSSFEVKDSAPMVSEQPSIELNSRSKVKRSRFRRQSSKNRKSVKEFNPRPPQLLEPRAEREQEQVNLRHQSVDERKAAEEWMIDYALRKALRRLTSVRKSKVPQLVAAFETVLPQKV